MILFKKLKIQPQTNVTPSKPQTQANKSNVLSSKLQVQPKDIDRYKAFKTASEFFKYYGLKYVKECFDELPKGTHFEASIRCLKHASRPIYVQKEIGGAERFPIKKFEVRFHYTFK